MTQKLKKYKYKKTGLIFEQTTLFNYPYSYQGRDKDGILITLPGWIVEDSNDWEKITSPLFTTEDGVEIFDENHILYPIVVNAFSNASIASLKSIKSAGNLHNGKSWLFFSSSEARDQYVLENKPLFSANEVIKYMLSYTYGDSQFKELKDYPDLQMRAKNKLNEST